MYKIGLFGFGVVGSAFYQLVEQLGSNDLQIAKIVIRNPEKERKAPAHLFSTNPADILEDASIDIVVELIDNADDALQIAKQALSKGKKIVSANKRMLAAHAVNLVHKHQFNSPLLYEAAVAGSIPIISTIDNYYAPFEVNGISGILNGTCNYILSRMHAEGKSYDAVLKEAQSLGFAESDPTLDVDGYDTRNKLSLLLLHAFGVPLPVEKIPLAGIRNIATTDLEFANQNDCIIKLVAEAKYEQGNVSAVVVPKLITKGHPFYNVGLEQNAVLIQTREMAQHLLTGKGAGGIPTASAVLVDVMAAKRSEFYKYHKWRSNGHVQCSEQLHKRVYIRLDKRHPMPLKLWKNEELISESENELQIIAELPLNNLPQLTNTFIALMPDNE
jgi:homoserine dehydrogenase